MAVTPVGYAPKTRRNGRKQALRDSHVVEENGTELEIFRRNTPYGTVSQHGTMFIGFSVDQHRLDRMLRRMAGAKDGVPATR